jgi:hypothetical protein
MGTEEQDALLHRTSRAARGVTAELPSRIAVALRCTAAPRSYQPLEALTIFTTESMTGTSIRTPTTVASAAPDWKPNRLMAAATASSKKLAAGDRGDA